MATTEETFTLAALQTAEGIASSLWPRYGRVSATLRPIRIDSLKTVQNVVQQSHLQRVQAAVDCWIAQGRPLFPPLSATTSGSAGVLVDLTDTGELMIIDGVHRCLAARNRGRHELLVTIFTPRRPLPPPGRLLSLANVEVSPEPTDLMPIRDQLDGSLFRPGSRIAADLEAAFALS
ncbi:hypothetical protein [Mycolicibacterium moriokaense]|uniref:Uncharacterized protein n=1 Tax=Mycolicibacterium moriokaense TaxID=39691 RepID=A0A318HI93_9MYCO|nr:hypothetical protein [Mycolicibacterium moriokaense]PXX09242.1 hypothetical protein C8E89_106169 [Mycolicibacterium moriokaense]